MSASTHEVPVLGIESMDREHRELVRLLDDFVRCIENGGSEEQASVIVQAAIRGANEHFDHEEQLAIAAKYPKIEEEQFHHRNMRMQFTTLAGDTLNFRMSDPVTLQHLAVMRSILEEHIMGPDKDLAEFLKAAGCK